MSEMSLNGKVALVTGGGKGIGKVYSYALADAGAAVCAADIDQTAAERTAAEIVGRGGKAIGLHLDVTKMESAEAMVKAAVAEWGRADILVNNAGLFSALRQQPFWEISSEEWDQVLAVNLKGLFHCSKAVFPVMKENGYGKIINISSGTVFKGNPLWLHYVSSKSAVIGFTRSLAREVAPFGIRVNTLAPGLTESDTAKESYSEELFQMGISGRMLQRAQLPEDLVGALLFLSSSASDFITGQALVVDGGSALN